MVADYCMGYHPTTEHCKIVQMLLALIRQRHNVPCVALAKYSRVTSRSYKVEAGVDTSIMVTVETPLHFQFLLEVGLKLGIDVVYDGLVAGRREAGTISGRQMHSKCFQSFYDKFASCARTLTRLFEQSVPSWKSKQLSGEPTCQIYQSGHRSQ